MRLVTADPVDFAEVVAAQSGANDNIFLAHADGTIGKYDEHRQLVAVWLNPGKRVSTLVVVDNDLFVAFDDRTARVISLETGLTIADINLPIAFSGVTVFEHVLVGWSKHRPEVCLLHRFNFEMFQTIFSDSFVTSVFAVSGNICVASSTDIYWIRHSSSQWKLEAIFHTSEFLIIGACLFNKRWLVQTPESWKIMVLDSNSKMLIEEVEVNTPLETLFKCLSSTSSTVVMQCTSGKYVVLQGNNIQVLSSPLDDTLPAGGAINAPRELLVGNAPMIVTSDLKLFRISAASNNELLWKARDYGRNQNSTHNLSQTKLASQKFLVYETDPKITAKFEDKDIKYIGTEDGKINGVYVFPKPVLHIDFKMACSEDTQVSLPLSQINVMNPVSSPVIDHRVTVVVNNFELNSANKWIGIASEHGIPLYHLDSESTPSFIAVMLVLEDFKSFDKALDMADTSAAGISQLEDLAVLACELNDMPLLQTTVKFLSRVWDAKRIDNLLNAGGPRSLKVMASVSPFLEIEENKVLRMINKLALAEDAASRDAVLWIFEHEYKGTKKLQLPFASLKYVSDITVYRFARNLVSHSDGVNKLLRDVAQALSSPESSLIAAGTSSSDVEAMAVKLLLTTLELPLPMTVPQTEHQLASIIEITIPAIYRRVPRAKSILVKLLAMHHVQFYQGKQRLLVPTPRSAAQAGYVFDMDKGVTDGKLILKNPDLSPDDGSIDDLMLGFSGDGKTVNGVLGGNKYIWQLSRGIQSFFMTNNDPIIPVKI